jgi:acyl-CoA synthetase (AMP-forming)/AMP-acid ligase II
MMPMSRTESTLIHQFLEQSAKVFPDKCALVQDERRATYTEIDAAANCLATWMIAKGVVPGDRVVILLGNSLEYVVSYYAILKAGAVAVPLNPELKFSGLQPILESLEPKMIILSERQRAAIGEPDLPGRGIRLLSVGGDQKRSTMAGSSILAHWNDVVGAEGYDPPSVAIDASNLATIIFTSGSTGAAKGVMLSHRNIVTNADSIIQYLRLSCDDIQMVVLPFFYVMGKSLLNTHFAVGGRVVINNRFAFAASVIKQMVEEKVTGFSGVPSTYAHLLHKSPLARYRDRLDCLRYCSQAGGHMARTTKEALLEILPKQTQLFVMYGATEASARLSYVEPERLNEKIDSIGRPIPNVMMKVLGEDGEELAPGQVGELVAKGANITSGYWRDPAATQRALTDHGYHTGDLGYQDRDGYFFLTGRKDHQLKVGGHRINPIEIEETLMATGLVVEAVVLGLPDILMGTKLVAVVVATEQTTDADTVLSYCAKILPKYKVPQELLFVEGLPKNSSGKVDKEKCAGLLTL